MSDFDGQNISINQFIRECKDTEKFINPIDKSFFVRLVKAKAILALIYNIMTLKTENNT